MCPKKRRHADKDSIGSRFGFRVFQRYYELTTNTKTPKVFDDFVDSSLYMAFVKFGRHMAKLSPIDPDLFVDFIIKNGVKLKDWQSDFVYETYLADLLQREPADRGIERTFVFLTEWAEENNCNYSDFFKLVTPTAAAYYIKTGKISPWLLYVADSAEILFSQFNEEHYKIINPIIDASVWSKKISKNADDVAFVKQLVNAAGM
jgi:hypothetical protein